MKVRPLAALVGACLALLLLPAPRAHAQGTDFVSLARFTCSAGAVLPTSPDIVRRYWLAGYGLGGGFEAPFTRNFSLIGQLSVDHMPLDRREYSDSLEAALPAPSDVRIDGFGLNCFSVLIGIRTHPPLERANVPFADLSIGVGYVSLGDGNIRGYPGARTPLSETLGRFASSVGVGYRRATSGQFGLFADAHWVAIYGSDRITQYLPVRVGVVFP